MSKLTLEEAARQYAWQMGDEDFPSANYCPYNRSKHPSLYSAYWKGWRAARAKAGTARGHRPAGEEGERCGV